MAAQQKPESTAVAKTEKASKLHPVDQARIDEARARNAVVAAIRGTIWSKELNETQVRAVAQYCRENNLDPVRHVEVLGGRIYLTAELYDEKGAPLIRAGIVQPLEPEFINADARLEKLAADGDQWAAEENTRRLRARIQHNVPEKAAAAVVTRFRITATGAVVTGVNWCGGGSRQRDPVGETEPTKTALTRSRRRAWKQIADVIPEYAGQIQPLEAHAEVAAVRIVEAESPKLLPGAPLPPRGTAGAASQAFGGYESTGEPERITPRATDDDDPYAGDAELADEEAE